MLFYTWKDVDRFVQMKREKWEKWALDIDVYVGEMVIYLKDMHDISKAHTGLQELFGIKMDNNLICLDMKGQFLEVVYEQEEDEKNVKFFLCLKIFCTKKMHIQRIWDKSYREFQ